MKKTENTKQEQSRGAKGGREVIVLAVAAKAITSQLMFLSANVLEGPCYLISVSNLQVHATCLDVLSFFSFLFCFLCVVIGFLGNLFGIL